MSIWDGELVVQPPPEQAGRISHPERLTLHMKSWDGARTILYLGLADLVNTAASHGILNSWRSFPWSRQVKASDLSVGAQRNTMKDECCAWTCCIMVGDPGSTRIWIGNVRLEGISRGDTEHSFYATGT